MAALASSSPLHNHSQRSSVFADRPSSLDAATSMSRNLQTFMFAPSPCNKPAPKFFPAKPTTTTATSSPILAPNPCFIRKSRKHRSRQFGNSLDFAKRSLFPFQKDSPIHHPTATFDLDFEPTLHHKQSYFDMTKPAAANNNNNNKDEDLDMDSDSSSSIFSDAEEDDDVSSSKNSLRSINSNASLFSNASASSSSTVDSYFSIPTSDLPQKTARNKMKSISNSALFNKPELSWNNTSTATCSPRKPRAWGMPSFSGIMSGSSIPSFPRPSKVRRTQSMFENPKDVVEELASSPSADMCQSIFAREDCTIKSFTVEQDPFRRIDRETLCEILDNKHSHLYDRHVVIDCRFEYEYSGGHIDGAININNKERLEEALIASASPSERVLLIFHCEYSAHRGPRMAMHLRSLDRQINMNRYPILNYPDIVVLSGGYSNFFESCKDRCFPKRYVEMNDAGFTERCEREMERFRRTMKTTRSFTAVGSCNNNNNTSSPVAQRSHSAFNTFRFPLRDNTEEATATLNTTPTQPARRRLGVPKCNLFCS